MSKVIDRDLDPVSVERGIQGGMKTLRLRIGEDSGEEETGSRLADLTPAEAKVLAYALLQEAERFEAGL